MEIIKENESFANFVDIKFNEELKFQINKTLFKTTDNLLDFMNEFNVYLSGSFALYVCSLKRIYDKPKDIDFYIPVKTNEEISIMLGKIICHFYKLFGITTINIKHNTDKYDYNFEDKFTVYEINLPYCEKIDLVFIFDTIDSVVRLFDFNMLKNYIFVDKTKMKLSYKINHLDDILNSEINISDEYTNFINNKLSNDILKLNFEKKSLERLKKYCERGYKINNIVCREEVETKCEKCCVCIEEKYLLKHKFECQHNCVCLGCYNGLKKKICPLCRAEKKVNYYKKILRIYYNKNNSHFTDNTTLNL